MVESEMLFISKREIINMLKKAYDEGWQGYQDLRDAVAEQIMDEWEEEYKERRIQDTGMKPVTNVTLSLEPVDNSSQMEFRWPAEDQGVTTVGNTTFVQTEGFSLEELTLSNNTLTQEN